MLQRGTLKTKSSRKKNSKIISAKNRGVKGNALNNESFFIINMNKCRKRKRNYVVQRTARTFCSTRTKPLHTKNGFFITCFERSTQLQSETFILVENETLLSRKVFTKMIEKDKELLFLTLKHAGQKTISATLLKGIFVVCQNLTKRKK